MNRIYSVSFDETNKRFSVRSFTDEARLSFSGIKYRNDKSEQMYSCIMITIGHAEALTLCAPKDKIDAAVKEWKRKYDKHNQYKSKLFRCNWHNRPTGSLIKCHQVCSCCRHRRQLQRSRSSSG